MYIHVFYLFEDSVACTASPKDLESGISNEALTYKYVDPQA